MTKKPTPETDAVAAYEGNWDTKALRMTAHSRKLERELKELRQWKKEMLLIESQWDEQIVGRLLGLQLGDYIKPKIEPKLRQLIRERDEARAERDILRSNKMSDPLLETTFKHLNRERDEACQVANGLAKQVERLRKERDEAREKYDQICYRTLIEINKVCDERDKLREALREVLKVSEPTPVLTYQKMEDICIKSIEGYSKMSDQEINTAIAEECGWTKVFSDEWGPLRGLKSGDKFYTGCAFAIVPDYCNDLNAMHEADGTLKIMKKIEMERLLEREIIGSDYLIWRATARQRAEAFLRTIGKWKEDAK